MSGKRSKAIANSRYYKNLTKRGNPTATKVNQGIKYYGYGVGDEKTNEIRGYWHSSEGKVTHSDVREWAAEQALENKYTYTLVLSLKEGEMESEDFVKAMELEKVQKVFGDNWRLITHYDSDHVHAHVIAFRNTTVQKRDFTAWTNEIKDHLTMAEIERIKEAKLEQERQEQERIKEWELNRRGWGKARDRDLDNGLG